MDCMKNLYGWISLVLALALLLFPLIPGKGGSAVAANTQPVPEKGEEITFRFKDKNTGEISVIGARDYILGVVSAEMPASYNIEALKAQTVAAYTFALYRKNENKKEDYDITGDSSLDQAYIDEAGRQKKWGESTQEYTEKILSAIDAVLGQTVTYNGSLALTLYTAISGGKTESAKNMWGKEYPYLVAVESVGDLLSPNYLSSATLSEAQIKEKLPQIASVQSSQWFASPVYSDSGTVLFMSFGETTLTGSDIRHALGLKSANFDVTAADGNFTFNVRGYGHLTGMSQYGANYMAQQGSTYKEILLWYYPGCSVS